MGSRLVKAKLRLDDIASLDDDQPLGRVCRPADVATVVRFLCSADAGYVTGQRIIVDGGSDASPTGSFR
jgi:NAD(P)-dependent dehydrogenase (short-subunit alcohol dehydrogenase family)